MSKDSESTIRLNTSMGQVGDDILGSTFMRSGREAGDGDVGLSRRFSTATIEKDPRKAEIGLVSRKNQELTLDAKRFSIISQTSIAAASSFQNIAEQNVSVPKTVTSNKAGPAVTSKVPVPL